jgi:SpoVK/Ycf46/Vps4 family AAA+-type ATPase
MTSSTIFGTISIQNMMQFKLMETVRFEDPNINMIVTAFVLSVYASLTGVIPKIFDIITSSLKFILCWTYVHIVQLYWLKFYDKYLRERIERWLNKKLDERWVDFDVQEVHMTTKNLSTLFPAVYWYVTNKLDLKKESPISFFKTEEIELNDNDKLINKNLYKEIPNHKQVEFNFKGHKFVFSQSVKKELITGSEQKVEKDNTVLNFKICMKKWEDSSKIQDEFLLYCMEEFAKNQKNNEWEQQIYNNNKGRWDKKSAENYRTLETLILKEGQKEDLIEQINIFNDDEEFCKEMGIPWRIGFLLYGEPGTGKTSFILSLSNYCKRDIYYLTLSSINDDTELASLLNEINCRKGILVIEDIDVQTKVVHKRNLIDFNDENGDKTNSKLSLSGILNAIDGIDSNHGRILIVTSNNPKKLDRALLRPGRIDHKTYLSKADHYQIREMYKKFFKVYPDENKLRNIEENKLSTAEITTTFKLFRNQQGKALEMLANCDNIMEEQQFAKLEKDLN